jgi:hypothetical protein
MLSRPKRNRHFSGIDGIGPQENQMNGTIGSVESHGSIIIIVWLDLEDGRSEPVYMDHRAFSWLLEGEGIDSPDDFIGRPAHFNGQTIEFLDNVEAA